MLSDKDRLIAKVYQEGYSLRAVADAHLVSHEYVRTVLEKLGIPRRSRGSAGQMKNASPPGKKRSALIKMSLSYVASQKG